MHGEFSKRIQEVPPSFLREIFEVIDDENIISFAGGLPNPNLFPIEPIAHAAQQALDISGTSALQYGSTRGIVKLRETIAETYRTKDGIEVHVDDIIITNGSQQGLDLLGKVLVNEGDTVAVENPTYIAAIQSFSLYRPHFEGIALNKDGIDIHTLKETLAAHQPKILYTIPNFQNPTGTTYSDDVRAQVAEVLEGTSTLLVEDDPYGEIRFEGERQKPFAHYTDNVVLLGSFSKIVAPGFRLGWLVARDKELNEKLLIAKQASDLHTSTLVQHIVYNYYHDSNAQKHIAHIAEHYKQQRDAMITALKTHLGESVSFTNPEGGMFIWATVPEHIDTAKLFTRAVEEGVAFVPGESFFSGEAPKNTMRLNYTNATPEQIDEGMQRLARALTRYEG